MVERGSSRDRAARDRVDKTADGLPEGVLGCELRPDLLQEFLVLPSTRSSGQPLSLVGQPRPVDPPTLQKSILGGTGQRIFYRRGRRRSDPAPHQYLEPPNDTRRPATTSENIKEKKVQTERTTNIAHSVQTMPSANETRTPVTPN